MLSAIGSSTPPATDPVTGVSTAGIEAQIARYKKQLADCINCPSAKTSQGKAAIQALSNKISAAEARIETLSAKSHARHTPATGVAAANRSSVNSRALAAALGNVGEQPSTAAKATDSSIGSLVDTFA